MTDGRAAGELRFEILGEVRALRAGVPVDLGPAKQRAVLAVLLLQAGRPVPTHQIVDAVWGDEPPENGANVVQKYVAGLRRALDPDRAPRTPGELLALTGGGYVLRTADCTLDVDEFQTAVARAAMSRSAGDLVAAARTLREGLALWRGDALAGLSGPVFDAARQRLAETRATAWEKWADASLSRGEATTLIPDLARLVEEFPLREGLRAQLMIALHQGGRQAEALAAFRDAREYFLDEFGAEPGERMQEAHRRILRGEVFFYKEPTDPWADEAVEIPPPVAPDSPASPASPAFPSSPSSPSSPPGPASPVFPASPASFASSAAPYPTYQIYPVASAGPSAPPSPAALLMPPRRRISGLEIALAAALPVMTCVFGSWLYFVIAGARRRDPRQYYVAAGYFLAFLILCVVAFVIDPSPLNSDDPTTAEMIGVLSLAALPIIAGVHGVVLAIQNSNHEHVWALREQARQFARFSPHQAREIGIGRPDLLRSYDDGGLIDLNHLGGDELARAAGLPGEQAHRIVADRVEHGPFRYPEDLLMRQLATKRTMKRLSPRLICIPPGPSPTSWPAA